MPGRTTTSFVALLAADAVSVTGNVMALLAIPWFVLQTTGSPTRTGFTAAAAVLPVVLSAGLGSALVDRVGFRRMSIISDLASGIAVAAIPLLHATIGLRYWQLLALVFVGALLDAPGVTARRAMLPDLIGEFPLERATAAHDGVWRASRMLGGPLAGILIATLGPAQVLYVDAATFLVSALVVRTGVPAHAQPTAEVRRPAGYLADVREGFSFVRHDRFLTAMISMVMITNMLDQAMFGVLLPVYADRVLGGAVDLGLVVGVFGAGALAGTVAFGAWGHRLPTRATFTVAFLLAGPPRYAVMAAGGDLLAVLVTVAISGSGAGALNPILSAAEYTRTPRHLRGRVLGTITAGVFIAMPAGAALAGVVVSWIGLREALALAGAIYFTAAISPALFPTWRELDAPAIDQTAVTP